MEIGIPRNLQFPLVFPIPRKISKRTLQKTRSVNKMCVVYLANWFLTFVNDIHQMDQVLLRQGKLVVGRGPSRHHFCATQNHRVPVLMPLHMSSSTVSTHLRLQIKYSLMHSSSKASPSLAKLYIYIKIIFIIVIGPLRSIGLRFG